MAKITFTLDLDWLGEDGSISDELKNTIAEKIVRTVEDGVKEEVGKRIDDRIDEVMNGVEDAISQKLNAMMDGFFDQERQVTNSWGEVKKTTTIRDMLYEACDKFMTEQVDSAGKPTDYRGKPRTEYMTERVCGDKFERTVKATADKSIEMAKNKLDELMKAQLGEKLAKLAGIGVEK